MFRKPLALVIQAQIRIIGGCGVQLDAVNQLVEYFARYLRLNLVRPIVVVFCLFCI